MAESRVMRFEIIRDPLWDNIRVDELALRLVDAPEFQRLRYVRQLGLTYLVYPGATHTRFEHALGAYHLSRVTLALLDERGALRDVPDDECAIVRAAALLHDIGHYPFSHALEEIGVRHHEEVAGGLLTRGRLAELLSDALGADAPARVHALIRGASRSPLQRLVSGSLDLDKLEYLRRDATMCGVPYGQIDVDRLIHSIVVVPDPATGRPAIGVQEKGLSALESLLFAKYQMFRNVYWHHAVRSATAMYKRLVHDALAAGTLDADTLARHGDEELLHQLSGTPRFAPLLSALRERRLHKRVLECPAAELPDEQAAEWIASDRTLTVAVEDRLAAELGVAPGDILLDYPAKTQMLELDLPVLRRGGAVEQLTAAGWEGSINLPSLSHQLYRSARWLRVFAVRGLSVPSVRLQLLLLRPAAELRELVEQDRPLLR